MGASSMSRFVIKSLVAATALGGVPVSALAQTSSGSPAIEEVIITAQRRMESLQDVPISVTALSSETLQQSGISGSAELSQLVPGFRLDYNGDNAQPVVRGVSTAVASIGAGSAVAIYEDGFLVTSPLVSD